VAIFRGKPYSGVNFVVDLGNGATEGSEAGLAEVIFPDGRLHTFEPRKRAHSPPLAAG
jgi:hypothetical protein